VRVALDTNLVVSGLLWGGTPGRIIDCVTDRKIEAVTSEALLQELARILDRTKFHSRLATKNQTATQIVALYAQLSDIVEPAALPAVIPGLLDPDDRHILACAVAARADLLISGDKRVQQIRTYRGIPVVDAAEALRRIQQRESPR
jgi:uncharacterized protein